MDSSYEVDILYYCYLNSSKQITFSEQGSFVWSDLESSRLWRPAGWLLSLPSSKDNQKHLSVTMFGTHLCSPFGAEKDD